MRLLVLIVLVFLLFSCDPRPAVAEGLLHPQASPPALKKYRSDCNPGQDPADLNCCAATLALCRLQCRDDYAANGDMLYLRHCERGCEEEARACQAGN